MLALGLHLIGNNNVAVYDGSWSEWGRNDKNTPVVTGDPLKIPNYTKFV